MNYDHTWVQGMIRLGIAMHEDNEPEETVLMVQGLTYKQKNGYMRSYMGRPYKPEVYPYRSQFKHPYSYSPIIIWANKLDATAKVAISRELYRGKNYGRAEKMCQRYFGDQGQYFNNRDPVLIQKWLAAMLKKRIELHMIVEFCNEQNGYPYWEFHYSYLPKK